MTGPVRVDVFLHRVCVARSRSQAGNWCEEGRVRMGSRALKASHAVCVGDELQLEFTGATRSYRILAVPTSGVAKQQRAEYLEELGS